MIDMVPFGRGSRLFGAVLACLAAAPAYAQDTSPWVVEAHSSARLLAGSRNGAVLLGGVEIKLEHGWKTYWRTPGDSGVPPRFDFSKSENVEAVTILWPTPMKFDDGAGGFSIGYKKDVLIPLRVALKNPDKPVILRVHLDYAVCEKLCVPVESQIELPFVSVASTEDNTLSSALDAVPKPANVGDPNPLTIRDVRRDGPTNVIVDVAAHEAEKPHLYVEGPTPDWSLPLPKLIDQTAPDLKRFTFALDGLPSGAKPDGAALKFTLVGGSRAYEFNVNLQ
ncbi:MAG: protein-disulfide reductase DsbD domain-containing protein [Afipia sp.]